MCDVPKQQAIMCTLLTIERGFGSHGLMVRNYIYIYIWMLESIFNGSFLYKEIIISERNLS